MGLISVRIIRKNYLKNHQYDGYHRLEQFQS